jgi:hypothetical protein
VHSLATALLRCVLLWFMPFTKGYGLKFLVRLFPVPFDQSSHYRLVDFFIFSDIKYQTSNPLFNVPSQYSTNPELQWLTDCKAPIVNKHQMFFTNLKLIYPLKLYFHQNRQSFNNFNCMVPQ